MIIRCPNCSTTYKVDGSVLDAPRPTFRCSRCKHIFGVQIHLQPHGDPEAAGEAGTPPLEEITADDPPEAGEDDFDPESGAPELDDEPDAPRAVVDGEDDDAFDEPGAPEPDDAQGTLDLPHMGTTTVEAPGDAEAGEDDFDPEEAPVDDEPSYPEFEPLAEPEPADLPQLETLHHAAVVEEGDAPVRTARQPDFEIDDDFLIPPKREVKPPPPPPRATAKGSIMPMVSFAGLALIAFGLVTLIYQINPRPLDSVLQRIPWYGNAVFDDRHFKKTLEFESLTSRVQPVLNQTEVFVVSGKLVNRNDRSIHRVRIEAQLFDADGKQIARQVTYVGNAISAKIIQDMSFREISLLQSLKPQSAYRIPANQSADFTIVFPKPESAVESFSCRVVSADAPA